MTDTYPCPCCGYHTLGEPPGSYEICPVCGWEDDLVQLRWPTAGGAPNKPSLVEAQESFAAIGAKSEPALCRVRPPATDEIRDPGWRPVTDKDDFEHWDDAEADWPSDRTALYWWRSTFWRRQQTR